MYKLTCPYGCKTEKTQQPRSFTNEETYKKHMREMHSDKEPIKDYQEELKNISDKMEKLELDNKKLKQDNDLLQSQLNNTQINSVVNVKKMTKNLKKLKH